MAALCCKRTFLQAVTGGGLVLADGRRGLEGNAKVYGFAIGNTTLDTTRVVGLGSQTAMPVTSDKWVIML